MDYFMIWTWRVSNGLYSLVKKGEKISNLAYFQLKKMTKEIVSMYLIINICYFYYYHFLKIGSQSK